MTLRTACSIVPSLGLWKRSRVGKQLSRSVVSGVSVDKEEIRTELASAEPSFKAYLNFKFIRDNVDLVKENCRKRNVDADPELVASLYKQYTEASVRCDKLRSDRKEINNAMKAKLPEEERKKMIDKGTEVKNMLSEVEAEMKSVYNQLQIEGQRLPNMTHPDVPAGYEEGPVLISNVGQKRTFEFPPKDHIQIGEDLDLLDFASAAEVSGSKFHYLKNEAAMLEMGLINWAFQTVVERGFTPVMTPDLIRESVLEKCGFQPRARNTQVYTVENSDLALAGTAEVPLGGMFMNKTLDESDLPIKLVAFGHCFRTEAGAPGLASKGLYRVHQFSKVEMFVLSTPEQSEDLLDELTEIEINLYTQLGLHFKMFDMPMTDLGAPAYRKFDIEAWMPGLERFGEISSASNCTDYQSRRLNIRYKSKDGKSKRGNVEFVHTLNATACAVPRLILAILENFQNEDGSVTIPEVIRPYIGGKHIILKDRS